MSEKTPVLLTVLLQTGVSRWFAAGIGLEGTPWPLLRSDPGYFSRYSSLEFDEQTSFLRHRLAGMLQCSCDRLWGKNLKPCQIIFVADQRFPHGPDDLTQRVADHFVQWMANPPVAFFIGTGPYDARPARSLDLLAGSLDVDRHDAFYAGLQKLAPLLDAPDVWEPIPTPRPVAP